MPKSSAELDVMLWGAMGFTGKLLAEALTQELDEQPGFLAGCRVARAS